jgi:hypothetical protein
MIHKVVLLPNRSVECCDITWANSQFDENHRTSADCIDLLTKGEDGITNAWITFPNMQPDWYVTNLCPRCENVVLWTVICRIMSKMNIVAEEANNLYIDRRS